MTSNRRLVVMLSVIGAVLVSWLVGCSDTSRGRSTSLLVSTLPQAVFRNSPITVSGTRIGYLADEASTGGDGQRRTDLNGDGDTVDRVGFLFDMKTETARNLGASCESVHLLGERAYGVGSEIGDGVDWNGDGDSADTVLLYFGTETVAVDTIDTSSRPLLVVDTGDRLYYRSLGNTVPGTTTLVYVDRTAEATSVFPVVAEKGEQFDPRLLAVEEGLLFTYLDETVEMADLNGDGDTSDGFVLALHDTTVPDGLLRSTGLAISDADVPFRAKRIDDDWLVGFPVSEAAHGDLVGGGFNDPLLFEENPFWMPPQCDTEADIDADLDDQVLHFLYFAEWSVDPVNHAPVNTGVVSTRRIIVVPEPEPYLVTVTPEEDEGGCDLNIDGDRSDHVIRVITASRPLRPLRDPRLFVATKDVPGGSHGLGEFETDKIATIVDEADQGVDYDLDGETESQLLGWIRPGDRNTAAWSFIHRLRCRESIDGDQAAEIDTAAGSDWFAETPARDRVLSTLQESAFGRINAGDTDALDGMPIWGAYDRDDRLGLEWDTFATRKNNSGICFAEGRVFYRADESASSLDINNDGDGSDILLISLSADGRRRMILSVHNDLLGPAIVLDRQGSREGAAFVAEERFAGVDLNGDGDSLDFVIRWFSF